MYRTCSHKHAVSVSCGCGCACTKASADADHDVSPHRDLTAKQELRLVGRDSCADVIPAPLPAGWPTWPGASEVEVPRRRFDRASPRGGDLSRCVPRPRIHNGLRCRRSRIKQHFLKPREVRATARLAQLSQRGGSGTSWAVGPAIKACMLYGVRTSQPAGVFLKSSWIAFSSRRSMVKLVLTLQRPFALVSSLPMLNTSSVKRPSHPSTSGVSCKSHLKIQAICQRCLCSIKLW